MGPKVFYEKMTNPQPPTRSAADKPCGCTVCLIARSRWDWQVSELLGHIREPDNPKPKCSSEPEILKQCVKCLSYIGRGRVHKCTRATKRSNLLGVVKSSSKKSKSRVLTSGLKSVFSDAGVSSRGGSLELGTGGKPITVRLGELKEKGFMKRPRWTHETLIKLQTNNNLSDKSLM